MNQQQQIHYWAHMLDECFNKEQFLCEDKEGKNINKVEKWIKDNHPEVIGQKLENGIIITPRVLTQEIRNTVPNVRMADCKFLVGVTRIYFDLQNDIHEFQSKMNKLNKILKIICTAHVDEYDNDFNRMSFDELDKKFSSAVNKELNDDREQISKLQLIKNSAYKIVPIDSFEEASKYGKYTSWCVTHYPDMYSSYTNGGLGRFYFCLQDGFENVPKTKGEGCPMDAYGKSMIAVSVNDDGSLNTCTCRWNHDNNGNDSMMDTKEISKFFGIDFYKTFKPYDIDQLWKKILEKQVPSQGLDNDDAEFCKIFGCIAVYESTDDENDDSSVVFKKLIDGKIITLPYIDQTITLINNKFVTMKDGKFVDVIPKTIKNIPEEVKGKVVIPSGVMRIENSAFNGCSKLTSVTIPDSVTSIEKWAFNECNSLTSVTIPDSVASIGNNAFCGCNSLMSVTIGNSVTSIGESVFNRCSSLTSVTIPNSVTSIGDYAFNRCSSLTSVTIPNSVTSIGDYAFNGCSKLTSMTIPNGVTSIGECMFSSCSNLTSVTIPNSVTSIGDYAFNGCSKLISVTIPNNVTSIKNCAFNRCYNLTSVTIPNSVTSIGQYAFYGCCRLMSVTIGNGVTSIERGAFGDCFSRFASVVFKGKTLEEVQSMKNYPFGIENKSIIKCENRLNESKTTYLQKYSDEADAKKIVDAFWQIKSRLSAPQNDIDWWIKKPFADLKSFVLNYNHANKRQRRDADYRKQALENDAKLLDTRDDYEIWYVPTYEAMKILGRFYKGRSAKWCVASDDPDFWFDNHDEDEFIVLVREHPQNDEFDKVAIQMQGHGRYFNGDDIVLWDLENNDDTFNNSVIDNARDLIYYAWQLFKDNGEQREQYYDAD